MMDSAFSDKILKKQFFGPNSLTEKKLPKNCRTDLVRHVDLLRPVGTIAGKVGEGGHQKRKALGVGEMPVEHVLLRIAHAVDQLGGKI